jgi:hypothetical protein
MDRTNPLNVFLRWKGEDPGYENGRRSNSERLRKRIFVGEDAQKSEHIALLRISRGHIMGAFEAFVRDNPALAERPYGEPMAATLRKAFPCNAQGT